MYIIYIYTHTQTKPYICRYIGTDMDVDIDTGLDLDVDADI